ncbi:MAG: helix-turn-helix transcriptional regulator [Gemmatimonadetes bacterium]|nr:helix-turn-helix transcriptional regulator [Gemmatimonadota bacterium]
MAEARPESASLAANLRRAREVRGLTQASLGEKAGMAAASVSHFETAQRIPSLESLVRLADALEMSVDALLGRDAGVEAHDIDPLFLRASRASAETLDTVRRVTAALLDAHEATRRR